MSLDIIITTVTINPAQRNEDQVNCYFESEKFSRKILIVTIRTSEFIVSLCISCDN